MDIYGGGQTMTLPDFVRDVRDYPGEIHIFANPAKSYTFAQILEVAKEYADKFGNGEKIGAASCVKVSGRNGIAIYEFRNLTA